MILVRDVFQLQFGKAKDAVEHWKKGRALAEKTGYGKKTFRVLTDLVSTYYTLVIESEFESLSEYEESAKSLMSAPEWKDWYSKFLPMAVKGHREIFKVEA